MVQAKIKKEFKYDIESIWDIITDNKNYEWRSDLSKIEIIDSTHFIEYTKKGYPTKFMITKMDYLKYYAFELENSNMQGNWECLFTSSADGTVLEFIEHIAVNGFFKKIIVKAYLRKQQKRYMKDLLEELQRKTKKL